MASEAKQSSCLTKQKAGLLRFARNDEDAELELT
jgi:hypothetical protein